MTSTAVRVGLRVRPLTEKEHLSNCAECISFIPDEPQVLVGTDKSFTFDYVFRNDSEQQQVYETAAVPLLEKFIEGFNATILAYGQTGSGKTFSMGTGLESTVNPEYEGIVPRCVFDLFRRMDEKAESDTSSSYEIYVSFLELYNEELIDLLNPQTAMKKKGITTIANPVEVTIREDIAGNIYWSGVNEEQCSSAKEVLSFLAKGSLYRTTGSTNMNQVSSRSHAVFSVILKQKKSDDEPSITSKFHFVDLAGSERLKRTNAQGDRAKEGISINSGLLALGNVISALGDEARKTSHIPYRDSKLTRLLQDSLGGNSQTLMLACVSPSDSNFMETLNTLKYANRARNIKNRVTINQEFAGSSIEVNQLKSQLARLRIELNALRAESHNQPRHRYTSDLQREDEVSALRAEIARLRDRNQDMSTGLIQVTSERDTLLMERELMEFSREMDGEDDPQSPPGTESNPVKVNPMVAQYLKKIQDLTDELADTHDRLDFFEKTKPAVNPSIPLAAPVSFSGTTFSRSTSDQTHTPRHKPNKSNKNRRLRVSSSSSTANNGKPRKSTKHSVRRIPLTPSSSTKTRRSKKRTNKPIDETDDEGFINEEELDEGAIQQSIAKAKAEIQKGMEVLDLIKPVDGAQSWEDEFKAFENAEMDMYSNTNPIQRSESDEGNFTAVSSPISQDDLDNDLMMDIEALSVPTWDHKSTRTSRRSKPIEEGDYVSQPSSTDSAKELGSVASNCSDRKDPQLIRMLHQIQSDIHVKEELVLQLEKSENKYLFLRRKFDEKISSLHTKLSDLQHERDSAIEKKKSAIDSVSHNKADRATQMKEKQQLLGTRHAYETKMKQLVSEIHELKRNYSRAVQNMQSTKNQNDSLLKTLRVNIETLKMEKKRMLKRTSQENQRIREEMALKERKISKLQKLQSEAKHARTKLEREHEAQKLALKRRDKEVLISTTQLKEVIDVLKRAVREGGVLDDYLLNKVSHVVGGNFAAVARRGGMRNLPGFRPFRKRKNPIPLEVRITRKKQLLDKMLNQYIQGRQAIVEMEQLLIRRESLASEKVELLEERKSISMTEHANAELTGEPVNTMSIELADERIDIIEAEISYLSARIRTLQSEAAGEGDDSGSPTGGRHEKRRVTFADDIINDPPPSDEWADMDAIEEQYSVPSNAAPELVYDATIKLLKSLEADESRNITEALIDDIFNSRMGDYNQQLTMQNLEKTVHDLRKTLIVMKRAAITSTIENERRIRKLEDLKNGVETTEMVDMNMENYIMNSGNTVFDKIYEDGLRGMIGSPEPNFDFGLHDNFDDQYIPAPNHEKRSSTHSEGLLPPPSPIHLAGYNIDPNDPNFATPPSNPNVKAPPTLSDKGGLMHISSSFLTRDSTPSPERFYKMVQNRLSWQQMNGGSESPLPANVTTPTEFSRYENDRDSSTSSIYSGHLRRSSIHSDYSSSQNSYNHTVSSTQSNSKQRPPSVQYVAVQQSPYARKRNPLRDGSGKGENEYYEHDQDLSSTTFQKGSAGRHQENHKRSPLSNASNDRSTTPTSGNVFDRLSQTPTRASQAKVAYRNSSSSIDDLRQKWEYERTPSVMSGTYHEDQ